MRICYCGLRLLIREVEEAGLVQRVFVARAKESERASGVVR